MQMSGMVQPWFAGHATDLSMTRVLLSSNMCFNPCSGSLVGGRLAALQSSDSSNDFVDSVQRDQGESGSALALGLPVLMGVGRSLVLEAPIVPLFGNLERA